MRKNKDLKTSITKPVSVNGNNDFDFVNSQTESEWLIETNEVRFKDLRTHWNFTDFNSVVLLSTTFEENQDYHEVNYFLSDELGFSKGKKLIGVHRIIDNVRGKEGRPDYLLEFDNPQIPFCYPKRLLFPDLIWVTDFIENFHEDYMFKTEKDFPGLNISIYRHNKFSHIMPIDSFR